MYGEVYENHVYYKDTPEPGQKFRQKTPSVVPGVL
jgi:hypothetical protein